jgi:TolA-binding protein
VIEYSAKRYENADIYLGRLAESRTDDLGAKARYYLGLSYYEQKRYDEAVQEFTKVRTMYTAYDEWVTRSMLALGDTYVKMEDINKAKDTYRTVLSKHKGNEFGQEAQAKLRELK